MNLVHWLLRAAKDTPDAPALLQGEDVVRDYAGFAARVARLAGAFADRGIRPGDRIALFMANRTDYLEIIYGAFYAGAAVVPINFKLHAKEAAFIIDDAKASLVIADAKVTSELRAMLVGRTVLSVEGDAYAGFDAHPPMAEPASRDPEDLAWLFYTSGTTGRPKGVVLTFGILMAMSQCYLSGVDEVRPGDAALYAAPMSHAAGMYNFIHVLRGARHVVPSSGGFDADEILDLAPRIRDISMFAAPTMIRRLTDRALARGLRGEGLRTIVYGGGPMYLADIEEAVEVFGPRFVQIYGQGESPMTITSLSRARIADREHPRWRERLASVGTAQACVEVRVADEEGNPLPIGVAGEIMVRGATVMAGYWRNEAATAQAIRDGWLRTGDVGALDEDGYLTLRDRSKDVIISGGSNIYPREVEEALLQHGGVHEVAVVGRFSAEWGEDVVAFVVPRPGHVIDPEELDHCCTEQIARFKRPKQYFVVETLPKNNYGKVLKTELRAQLRGVAV